nr:hypothetical protein BgiMline_032028 [Biomphalaria glabrata]
MNEEIETRSKHHGNSNYRLNKRTFSAANSTNFFQGQTSDLLSNKCLMVCLVHLLTLKMATLNLTSKHSVANRYQLVILSKQLIFLGNLLSDY